MEVEEKSPSVSPNQASPAVVDSPSKRQKVLGASCPHSVNPWKGASDSTEWSEERRAAKESIREAVSKRPEITAELYKAKKDPEDPTPFGGTIARYYLEHYYFDVQRQPSHDMYVYLHSNKLVVVGIAATHPLVRDGDAIVELESGNINGKGVEEFQVSGKMKRGGAIISQSNILCKVKTAAGKTYDIYSPLPGKVIEYNSRILETPDLLRTRPLTSGFIAILSPKVEKLTKMRSVSNSKTEYLQRLRSLSDEMSQE